MERPLGWARIRGQSSAWKSMERLRRSVWEGGRELGDDGKEWSTGLNATEWCRDR